VEDIIPHEAENVEFPTEGGKRYFEIYVRQKKSCMALNKIRIALTDNAGRATSVFLEDAASGVAATIDFDLGTGVERAQNMSAASETHPWTGTGYTKTKGGVKIFTKGVIATEKDLVFRYYLTSNTSIKPTEVDVEIFDARERLLASKIDWRFESTCVDCPGEGPKPPEFLSAVQYDNGIKLEWNRSPDFSQEIVAYKIYRRPSGVSYNPQTIAVVPENKRVYYDRFDKPGNNLEAGTTYLYSIASVGEYYEGCNGPPKIGCTGYYCPLMCVNEIQVTAPALPLYVLYANRMVRERISDVKAKYGVTMLNDRILSGGAATFTAGYALDITDGVTVENGAAVNFKVDPAVQ